VPVVSVNCLGRCNKGPNIRILTTDGAFVEVSHVALLPEETYAFSCFTTHPDSFHLCSDSQASMVRSVGGVVDLLQTHLQLDVNVTSAEVLRLN
jgi:hypothetical protein